MKCWLCRRERPREELLLGSDPDDHFLLSIRGYNGKPGGTLWPEAECLNDRTMCDRLTMGRWFEERKFHQTIVFVGWFGLTTEQTLRWYPPIPMTCFPWECP